MRTAAVRVVRRLGVQVPAVRRLVDQREALRAEVGALRLERESWRRERARLVKELDDFRARERPGDGLRYLFIVTYGRSGSTLLQGVLSSIPGYLIRGENRAMMDELYGYHRKSVDERRRLARKNRLPPTHPFFGIDGYPDDTALRDIRRLALDTILRPERGTRVVGFKEIRWGRPDLKEYLGFLREVFPEARFVVNTRDIKAVAQSKWWAQRENAAAQIAAMEAIILEAAESLGDAAFHVHYDDYVDSPGTLRDLYAWLGEDFDEEAVRATMSRRHSY